MSSNIRLNRICVECKMLFVAKTTVTKFCSRTCNSRNLKSKIKQLKIRASNAETEKRLDTPIIKISEMQYLTILNTCKLLNISRTTLWRLIKSKIIVAYNIGGKAIIKKIEIDNLFNKI